MNTLKHKHSLTDSLTNIHTQAPMHNQTHKHPHTNTHTQKLIHKNSHTNTHTQKPAHKQTPTGKYSHTHKQVYTIGVSKKKNWIPT